jgi:NitT/TauT family transport system substrate-binding protein
MSLLLRVLLLASLLSSASAAALTKVRFLTDWYPQPEHGGFYYALLKGYYREAGLEVEIVPGGPNSFAMPRITTGHADISMSSTEDLLLAIERGLPVLAIGATMQHDPQGIMVHDSSPVRRFEDLEGRTIAVVPGSAWFTYMIKRFDLKGVKERPLTFSVAPFLTDTNYITQCFITSEPFFVEKAGMKARVLPLQKTGYDPYRVFFTTRKYAKENPRVVAGFVAASIRGWKEYMDDPDIVHAELQKRNPELNADKMRFSWQSLKEGKFVLGDPAKGDSAGRFADARWKFQYDILKDLGLLKQGFDYKTAFTSEFMPK